MPGSNERRWCVAVFTLVTLSCLVFPAAAENVVPAENNPPGDIPDTQVFVVYAGPGFHMQVPEGWARLDLANGAQFSDKYNTVLVTAVDASAAPSLSGFTADGGANVIAAGRAVTVDAIKQVKLDGGRAIRIDYASNSEPNPVTNKQIRLEDVRFLLFKGGRLVTLDMAAPFGADNVDQWNLMANSIRVP